MPEKEFLVHKKDIYLIRHGETDYNLAGLVQGSGIDAPLNTTGHRQALAFYHNYCHVPFDKIYVSELTRAYQSVASFVDAGIAVEKHSGLNEICWGQYEGQSISASPKAYFDDLWHRWRSGEIDIPIAGGGESPLDVAMRQKPVLDLILSRPEEKNVLICMHGRAMRILLCQLLDRPLKEMENFLHTNLSLYHIRLSGTAGAELTRENCQKHLALL